MGQTKPMIRGTRLLAAASVSVLAFTACGPGGGGATQNYVPPDKTPCTDGALGVGETDIDCGGTCGPCGDGKSCVADNDCSSGFCTASQTCGASSCDNQTQDPGETGVDCGGTCAACIGDGCGTDDDCQSGYCNGGQCDIPTCADGLANGLETGVDCGGGDCPLCAVGQACLADQNCISGYCKEDYCAEPSCTDGSKNGNETDVDCGGACPGCDIGQQCDSSVDCAEGICPGGLCISAPASCTDNEKNGTESDVDCGGSSCPSCASSKFCNAHTDCLSETCSFGVCKDPTCDDDVANQGESDVDCGGPCGPCGDGLACDGADDCESGRCPSGTCATCTDGNKDADELGTDCGGACEACGDGTPCDSNAICGSGLCVNQVCVACDNGYKDGDETDIDCGGSCGPCAVGKACGASSDCGSSDICEDELCCVPNACGFCGELTEETCNGIDDDCDGTIDEASEIGAPPACDLQAGVCSGSVAMCQGTAGWVCDAGVYSAHSAAYEASESSCDSTDNDCDGQVDEALLNSCGQCGEAPPEVCNGIDDDCNGQVDESEECQACGTVGNFVCGLASSGQNALAWADGKLHVAFRDWFEDETHLIVLTGNHSVVEDLVSPAPESSTKPPHIVAIDDTIRLFEHSGARLKRSPGGAFQSDGSFSSSDLIDINVNGDELVVAARTGFESFQTYSATGLSSFSEEGDFTDNEVWISQVAVSDGGTVRLGGSNGDLAQLFSPQGSTQSTLAVIDTIRDMAYDEQGRLHVLLGPSFDDVREHTMRLANGTWTESYEFTGIRELSFVKHHDGKLSVVGTDSATVWYEPNAAYTSWTANSYGPFDSKEGQAPAAIKDPFGRVIILEQREGFSEDCIQLLTLCPDQ